MLNTICSFRIHVFCRCHYLIRNIYSWCFYWLFVLLSWIWQTEHVVIHSGDVAMIELDQHLAVDIVNVTYFVVDVIVVKADALADDRCFCLFYVYWSRHQQVSIRKHRFIDSWKIINFYPLYLSIFYCCCPLTFILFCFIMNDVSFRNVS